ncbi:MAG: hypothetical protein E2O39_12590 [Planctomycetota bacterium]|nr:MAG: hypothetical protein E2O39_12590 [Planctomycetota bacterium]
MKPTESTPIRRKNYVTDLRMQLSVSFSMVGMLVAVCFVYAVTLWLMSDWGSVSEDMSSNQATSIAMFVNGIFFLVALLSSIVVSIIATHRIAGPAMVIERAVRGLCEGDFEKRLTLREKDHLKSLAASVRELRTMMLEERKDQRRLHVRMESALGSGDTDLALELCRSLIGEPDPKPADKAAAVETIDASSETEPEDRYSNAG